MTFFVVERYTPSTPGKPQYARLFGYTDEDVKPEWTEDVGLALQFAREQDAAWFANLFKKMFCLAKITEHKYLDRP